MRAYKEALQQLLKNRLLNFRAEHGYSQEKIAELLHISLRCLTWRAGNMASPR